MDFAVPSFVGRTRELEELDASLAKLKTHQRPILTLVRGPSSQGKTSLLSHWVKRLRSDELVLQGRCLERESVPFKGLDTIVDALAWQLGQMSASALEALRPADTDALVQLFPVLENLWCESASSTLGLEPAERRKRAVSSLRDLISRMARLRVVVITLDDFHWADADTTWLLEQLVDHVNAPPVSLVIAYRDLLDPGLAIARIGALRRSPHVVLREIRLDPLKPDEARAVALPAIALKQRKPLDDLEVLAETEALIREAAGNPLHLSELVRGRNDESELNFDRLVTRRILGLPPTHRQALSLAALVGAPVERMVLRAAGRTNDDIDALVADGLLRPSDPDGDLVELKHDRIARLTIGELESDALPNYHLQLATAFARIDARPEVLAEHFAAAGERERALVHAERASRQAMDTLAFNQAAVWIGRCIAWLPKHGDTVQRRRDLERRLVDAYVNSGRLAEGAELLLAQANEPDIRDAAALRIRAVEYLLISGRIQDGAREAGKALSAVGLTMPRGRLPVLFTLWRYRRGIARDLKRFERGVAPRNDPVLRARAETCRALASGFATHDTLLVLYFLGRWRQLSLEIGDYKSFGYAVAKDAAMSAGIGSPERGREFRGHACKILGVGEQETLWLDGVLGSIEMYSGNFGKGVECSEVVRPKLEALPEMQWERRIVSNGLLWGYLETGRFRDAIALSRQLTRLGSELRDIKQIRTASAFLAWALICIGEFEAAEQTLADVQGRERDVFDNRYLFADAFCDFARIYKLLRTGLPEQALSLLHRLPAGMKRVGLWYEVHHRDAALALTANAELQVWLHSPSRAGLRRLRKILRRLARASTHHRGNAAVLEAALCHATNNTRRASEWLMKAEACFTSSGALARRAAVQICRATLVEGNEARRLRAEADEYFRRESIRQPEALVTMLVPGFLISTR